MSSSVDAGAELARGGRLPRVGAPQAAAGRSPGGVRRTGLPRRRDGRHRRAGRRVQAGAVPALPRQARAVPRAARRPGRRRCPPQCTTRSRPPTTTASGSTACWRPTSTSSTATDSEGAFRLIFETDLGNDPAVRERVEAVTQTHHEGVADTVAADTGLGRAEAELLATALTGAAQVAARWWLDSDRRSPRTRRSGCSSRCCGAASRTSRATGNRAIRPASGSIVR